MKVVFLYTELADYFLKCCEELSKSAEIHIVRWPVNKEAPFKFTYSDRLKIYDKEKFNFKQLEELLAGIQPDVLICSGWVDKDYLKLTKKNFKKIPTVLTCDTHWRGDLKQYLALILSRFFLLDKFSHAWVPGQPQKKYVRNLGFKEEKISLGFYSCDLSKFNKLFEEQFPTKQKEFPKRFLYVGRYYEFKGIKDLWQAFIELQSEEPNEWELWCLGAGDIEPIVHPKIKHFGFVQPKDLDPILQNTGVFILPSRFEPWGVVVQEYAAAGFPIMTSEAVGASEAFLTENKNGFFFQKGNVADIKNSLKKMINLSSKDLILMSEKSHALAQKNSPKKWADVVVQIYNDSKK